ncbi:MAG: hypothetical protein ACM3OC_00790 [Deltaproteobacteria bacterium]
MENLNPEPKPEPKKTGLPLGKYALYAVCVIAGIGIAKVAFDRLTTRFAPKAPVAARAASVPPRPYTVQPPAPAPVQQTLDAVKKKVKQTVEPFELNGICLSGSETFALINNQMVQEGDEVDGATVVKIGEEEVELKHNDKIIRLQTRNK